MASFSNTELYAPCPCGSGNKFKFCCYPKARLNRAEESQEPLPPHAQRAQELVNQGVGRMEQEDWAGARKLLEEALATAPGLVRAYTNLALVHFMSGDLAAAQGRLREVLDHSPGHTFALAMMVETHLAAGQERAAREILPRLRVSTPREVTHFDKAVAAFAQLREHEELLAYARRFPWPMGPNTSLLAGIAALNVGNLEAARGHLEQAAAGPLGKLAQAHLKSVRKGCFPPAPGGQYSYPSAFDGFPQDISRKLQGMTRAQLAEYAARTPALVEYLCSTFEVADPPQQLNALLTLAAFGTPRAFKLVEDVARGTFGSDELRLTALRCLSEAGRIKPGESQRVFLQEKYTTVEVHGHQITPDDAEAHVDPFPIPEAQLDLYEQSIRAVHARQLDKAVQINRVLLQVLPTHPVILHNLGAVLLQTRTPSGLTEAKRLFLQAVELHPTYHFARANLARQYIREQRLADAQELLHPRLLVVPGPAEAVAQLFVALAELALAKADVEGALRDLKEALALAPEDPVVLDLARRLEPFGNLFKAAAGFREKVESKRTKMRSRALNPNASVAQGFKDATAVELKYILRGMGIRGQELNQPKAGLLGRLERALKDKRHLQKVLNGLSLSGRQALQHILRLGGWADETLIGREHDSDMGPAPPEPLRAAPARECQDSVLVELTQSGLAWRGAVLGVPSLMVPEAARNPLDALLREA